MYRKFFKRFIDIFLSSLAIICLSPLLLIVAILVRCKLGSPVLFKQPRPGKNEKIFFLYKFRSMTNATDQDGKLLPDSQRLTKFGKFLRKSSIDELPELFNILRGDMSIVGPRPLSIYYLPHYPAELRKRHLVRPGLSGLAQIHGRNNLQWDDRFKMDVDYVDRISFLLDIKIIIGTLLKVFKSEDIIVRGENNVKDYGPYRILQIENNSPVNHSNMEQREIGSHFWLNEKPKNDIKGSRLSWLPVVSDDSLTFSGRNAIYLVFKDIISKHKINTVWVPDYSCVSMLQGIIDNNLHYKFYHIDYRNNNFSYQLPTVKKNDVVLIMSYFGLDEEKVADQVKKLKASGAIVVEDITHSLLSKISHSPASDYLVASLRKWFPIPTGGWMGIQKGTLNYKPDLESNHAVENKLQAMLEKGEFIAGKTNTKESFLLKHAQFENDLIHLDRMLKIDDYSLQILEETDIERVKSERVKNGEILKEGLSLLSLKDLSIPDFNFSHTIPLFIPVFLPQNKRDLLQKHLISSGVYCPVHWPEVMGSSPGVRENELSLICDQRYNETDMDYILKCISDLKQEL